MIRSVVTTHAQKLHNLFLYTASLTFIVAYLLLFLAVLLTPGFPRLCVYVFAVFTLLIAGSLLVSILTFFFGPVAGRPRGRLSMRQGRKSLSLPQSSPDFWRYFLCSHYFRIMMGYYQTPWDEFHG